MVSRTRPPSCAGCPLVNCGTDFSAVEGSGHNKVMCIAEASGEGEARDELPLRPYMPSGAIFERTIRRLGLGRDSFSVTNVLRCRPPQNLLEGQSYEYEAIQHCEGNLLDALRKFRPKVLLAFGNVALRTLTGMSGTQKTISHLRGYVLRALPQFCAAAGRDHDSDPLLVLPTYHPSFLRGGAIHLTGVLARDIARAVNVAAGRDTNFILDLPDLALRGVGQPYDPLTNPDPWDSGYADWEQRRKQQIQSDLAAWLQRHNLRYQLHPTRRDLDRFCRDVKARSDAWLALSPDARAASYLCLSHDIETFESASLDEDATDGFTDTQVRLSQFSIDPGQGVALQWDQDGIAATRWLNKLPLPKCGHNCFAQNTSVWMADGTWKPIWKVTDGEKVKSLKLGQVVESKVCGTLHTKDDRGWLEVKVDGAYNRGVGRWGNPGVICTPDHEWFLYDGTKTKANQLQPGDQVPIPRTGHPDLIIGTLLGDGYVSPRGVLKVAHTNKAWAQAKATAFGTKLSQQITFSTLTQNEEVAWMAQCYVPRRWRSVFYEGRQKVFAGCGVPYGIFPSLSNRALAVFYGDDGFLASKQRKNKTARVCLHGFAPETYDQIKKWFEDRFQGRCSIQNKAVLALGVGASKKFFEAICRFLHPCVEYKLPESYRGKYNGWIEYPVPQLGWVDSVRLASPKQYSQRDKYCITVEDTHSFFTRAGLVSNCWLFDRKVLRAVGERDFGNPDYLDYAGTIHDTLQQHHFAQPDLPAHLQFSASFSSFPFPWKHYNEECLEFYGIVDTDAALRVYQTTRKTMEDRKIWWDPVAGRQAAGYVAQVEMVRPILAAMEDRGLPIDDKKRLELGVEFDRAEKEARVELDARFPDAARKIHPYKTVPEQVREMLEEVRPTEMPPDDLVNEKGKPLGKGAREKLRREALAARWVGVTEEELTAIRQRRFQEASTKNDEGEEEPGEWYYFDRLWLVPNESGKKLVKSSAGEMGASQQWCRVYEFSPNSSPQLMAYMTARRHKIPESKDGKKTTGKKELIRLSARWKDTFYLKVIECREIRKAKGTYVEGFRPHADGRVHTTFTFATAIGQLSSRNPNIQNFPKHGRLAKAVREMVVAEPGMLLAEWDFKSCHVLTLGYLANDPNYIRLARIDMHSIMTGHFLKLWRVQEILKESDAELKARCKWLKSNDKYKDIRDSKIKHAGLGIGNGLKANGLYDRYMEFFSGVAEAKAILAAYEEVFPKVFAWQRWVQQRAHEQTFLQTEFGHLRHYYEVFRWDGRKSEWGHGDQGEEAISFWLSNIAFGHIREKLKELDRAGLAERYGLCDNIHDSCVFHFDERLLEEMLVRVRPILESPSKVLIGPAAPEGLWIGVDCAVGKNWGEMREVPALAQVEERVEEVAHAG
jgi:uracil-DNA glycosylase family 4